MNRALGTLALTTLGLLAAPEASAGDMPYMWAIGPRVGTIVVPGRYPLALPSSIDKYNFIEEGPRAGDDNGEEPKRDLDANGNPLYTSIERVRDDIQFGADGFYALDKENRIGAGFGLAFGKSYSDLWFTFNYDRVLVTSDPFNVVAGLGAGFGNMKLKGTDEDEVLRVPHFPVRAHIQGQFLDKTRLYALGVFAGTNIPSNHYYTDLNGNEQEIGSAFNWALNLYAGLEAQIMFGDLTPPKKKKKKGKGKGGNKGGGNKKKGGGGGGGKKKK